MLLGALVHYVLAKWASEGASGLLELGTTLTRRLNTVFDAAEQRRGPLKTASSSRFLQLSDSIEGERDDAKIMASKPLNYA